MAKKLTTKTDRKVRPARRKKFKLPKFSIILKKTLRYSLILALWAITVLGALMLYYAHDLPDFEQFYKTKKIRKVTLVNGKGEVLINYGDLYGKYVHFDEIPENLIKALISTEDRRFYSHFGIDPFGLLRATYENTKAKKFVQGGSTITQQLAKLTFLTPNKTIKRKIQELILAFLIENKFTKKQIIEAYLNRVYLGSGLYGIDSAAKYYFGKDVKDLDLLESAIIIGLLKAPSRYSPTHNTENSGKRAYQVLANMQNAGFITKSQLDAISAEPVILETSAFGNMHNSYYTSWILDQVNQLVPDGTEDLIVYTTAVEHFQEIAEKVISDNLKKYGKKFNATQGAIVAMDPHGTVLAIVGGVNYEASNFNRAVQAYRQPGSAFKHIIYITAFENGATPEDIEIDEPISIGNWHPRNDNRKFSGEMTLREAFARSINTIAVKLSERSGRNNIIKKAREMGITSEMHAYPSMALGVFEVNLLELTSSYATIANGGWKVNPYGITKITTKNHKILYQAQVFNEKVISDKAITYAKDVLINTVKYGSGKRAALENKIAAGKTGTTQENRDAWFMGFTDDIVVGVWVGNDLNSSNKLGGSFLPAIIWKDFVNQAYQ